MQNREIIILQRDCFALMVPSGARILLHEGTEVTIMQDLGNTFTVNIFGNLARIDAKDADAIGRIPHDPLADLPQGATLAEKVWAQLKTVFDPEIPVNIVDLGLIYNCELSEHEDGHHAQITMTLTAPGCGMGPVIAEDARARVLMISEITQAQVDIIFEPPWDRAMMSDAAKLELGMF